MGCLADATAPVGEEAPRRRASIAPASSTESAAALASSMPARAGFTTLERRGDEPPVSRPEHKQAAEQTSGKGQVDWIWVRGHAAKLVGPRPPEAPSEAASFSPPCAKRGRPLTWTFDLEVGARRARGRRARASRESDRPRCARASQRDEASLAAILASHAPCPETGEWPSDHGAEALTVIARAS